VADRPFTALARTREDVALMTAMLDRLRAHVATVTGHRRRTRSRIDRVTDDDRSQHQIVLPSIARTRRPGDLFAVGFFGQARGDVDHAPIVELESALIEDMPGTPGLVAYYNTFQPGTGWGNLVLFEDEQLKAAWGGDPRHADAVVRSSRHYHSIRLHNARAVGGLTGSGGIELIRTRLLDYREVPAWRAVRRA
jgi:hypothetical protein